MSVTSYLLNNFNLLIYSIHPSQCLWIFLVIVNICVFATPGPAPAFSTPAPVLRQPAPDYGTSAPDSGSPPSPSPKGKASSAGPGVSISIYSDKCRPLWRAPAASRSRSTPRPAESLGSGRRATRDPRAPPGSRDRATGLPGWGDSRGRLDVGNVLEEVGPRHASLRLHLGPGQREPCRERGRLLRPVVGPRQVDRVLPRGPQRDVSPPLQSLGAPCPPPS